ncbi:MAG: hypothetical protein ACOZB0_06400 [Pseudomonadota bacterium]
MKRDSCFTPARRGFGWALWLLLALSGCDQTPRPAQAPPVEPATTQVEPATPVVIAAPVGPTESPRPQTFRIPAGKTRIHATVTEVEPGYHPLRIEVKEGRQSYHLESVVAGLASPSDLPGHLNKTIGWKGQYLFVRSECGGGNAFRCDVDHVFKRVDGELRKLGTIGVWPTVAANIVTIGPGFQKGLFLDVDATLEGNEFTGHAGAPFIKLALRDEGNWLTLDQAQTWKINRDSFAESLTEAKAAVSDPDADTKTHAANSLLFNLAVAKLTDRNADYRDALALIQKLSGKTHGNRLAKEAHLVMAASSNPNRK